MDQAPKPKVLLLHTGATEDPEFLRLQKAIAASGEATVKNIAEIINEFDLHAFDFIFTPWGTTRKEIEQTEVPLIHYSLTNLLWETAETEKRALLKSSLLIINGFSTADLTRMVHLFTNTKRLPGVTPLMEKGSKVFAEKIQSPDSSGTLMDKLVGYLRSTEGFSLGDRLTEARQALSGVLQFAYWEAKKNIPTYPTVDFQVGLNANKLSFNLRFPAGDLNETALKALIVSGRNLFLEQAWHCSDLLLITYHSQYKEIELMGLLFQKDSKARIEAKSLLSRTSDRSKKSDPLLVAPPNFEFKLISDLRSESGEDLSMLSVSSGNEEAIDLGSLPPTVVTKLEQLEQGNEKMRELIKKREAALRGLQEQMKEAGSEVQEKRNQMVKLLKKGERAQDALKEQIADLQNQLDAAKEKLKTASGGQMDSKQYLETIQKLEQNIRAMENEKGQGQEKLANEQKKVANYEQKYSSLFKDLSGKEKEIQDLKTALSKVRKDVDSKEKAKESGTTTDGDLVIKLKDLETKESTLKQELKKITFKLEQAEKNAKAIQMEFTDKAKLMEQKLQGAKTKEVELLKKIDELNQALKKATKAA
jgi:predicted  nucleic acid-binding Zn-ribbon protein